MTDSSSGRRATSTGRRRTRNYRRHGTTDLFAALNVETGEITHALRERHAGADVLAFFKQIDRAVPRGLDVHVVVDNLSAHKAPEMRAWLAHPRRRDGRCTSPRPPAPG